MNRQHFALSAFTVLMLVRAISVFAEPVFVGSPITKVSEGGISRTEETLPPDRAATLLCVISTDNGKYYWASRGNVELIPLSAGAFTTYIAVNGSGFVRVIPPGLKEVASLAGETETRFDYVEHLLLGLRSVTYYGVAK